MHLHECFVVVLYNALIFLPGDSRSSHRGCAPSRAASPTVTHWALAQYRLCLETGGFSKQSHREAGSLFPAKLPQSMVE